MIIINKQDIKQVLLSVKYKDENELRNVFVSNVGELLSGVTTIGAKSFIYIKELDGVDVALIGNDGSIFLVETKLAANDDARKIVTQLLDYATKFEDKPFKYFETHWLSKSRNKSKTLLEELKKHFENGSETLVQLRENWDEHRFNLIVVMDKISDKIKRMARKLRDIPNGIELTKYPYDDSYIIAPKILWEEDVKISSSYIKQLPDDSKFLDSYTKAGLGKQMGDFVSLFVEFEENKKSIDNIEVHRLPKYLQFRTSNRSVEIIIHYNPKYEDGFQIWCNKIGLDGKVIEMLRQYDGMRKIKPVKKSFGKVAEWDLRYFSKETFEEILQKLSKIE